MLKQCKTGDLIKITGRSYTPLKDKPVYLVIEKEEHQGNYSFLLLDHSGDSFWTSFRKESPYDNVLIVS
jgi:hypothetical protein